MRQNEALDFKKASKQALKQKTIDAFTMNYESSGDEASDYGDEIIDYDVEMEAKKNVKKLKPSCLFSGFEILYSCELLLKINF